MYSNKTSSHLQVITKIKIKMLDKLASHLLLSNILDSLLQKLPEVPPNDLKMSLFLHECMGHEKTTLSLSHVVTFSLVSVCVKVN